MTSRTFQQSFTRGALPGQDPSEAAFLDSRGTLEANLPYTLGRSFGRGVNEYLPRLTNPGGRHPLGALLEAGLRSPATAGVLAALAGGLTGAAGGRLAGMNPWATGAAAAGVGGLGAAYLSRQMRDAAVRREQRWNQMSAREQRSASFKQASAWRWPTDHTSPDMVAAALMPSIAQRVMLDSRMPMDVRLTVNNFLPRLNTDQLTSLDSRLRTALSAGAGALVAKYLFNAGIGGTLLGGLAGAFIGRPAETDGSSNFSYWRP